LTYIQFPATESCLQRIVGEGLAADLPDLQQPPNSFAALIMLKQGFESGIDRSLILLLPFRA